jgi:tetratricopeptide (TPR) repeat protein
VTQGPKVFISYSHDSEEHRDRVRALADRLCVDGVDCTIDQYEPSPAEIWPIWMDRQIEEADFVLVVCTETYLRRATGQEQPGAGRGATFESVLILRDLYDKRMWNEKFLPVLFDADERVIPRPLRGYTSYRIESTDEYDALLRRLTGQPRVVKPVVGSVRILPPDAGRPAAVSRSLPTPSTFLSAIGQGLLRRWPWTVAVLLLACSGLAWIWWTLHQPSRLYQKGLQAMATLDLPEAQDYLERAVSSGDDLPLERSALAEVLMNLGRDDRAKTEANHAFNARKNLADNDRLLVEARYWRITGDELAAIQKYKQLWKTIPGEVEYAVALADAQIGHGQYPEALRTVEAMQKTSEDPRLDLMEAKAAHPLGQFSRQFEAASGVVDEAEKRGLDLLAAEGLLQLGIARAERGESQKAIADFRAAEQRSKGRNPEQAAQVQNAIALVQYRQGDLREAEKWYGRALRSYQDLGDLNRAADQQLGIASVHADQGKLGEARKDYENALKLYTNRSRRAAAIADFGWLLIQQGEPARAAERLEEAIGIFEETREREQAADRHCMLSQAYLDNLELELAKRSLEKCFEVARDVGGSLEANALFNQGNLLLAQGDLKRAREAYQRALKIYEELDSKRDGAWSRLVLAEIQLERDHALEAKALIEPALEYFRLQRMLDDVALAKAALARTYLAQGAIERAQSLIEEAKERLADSELLELRVQVALTEARVFAAMKNVPEARNVIQRELANPKATPRLRLLARLAQGEIEMIYGDRGRGRELLSRVKEDAGVRGYGLVEDKAARLLAASTNRSPS